MLNTRDMVLAALFAALTAALGFLPMVAIPGLPAAIHAQTLGVMLSGAVLGAKRGGLAQVVFIALTVAGLPLMAGGRGGIGLLIGPTGGFALGYIPGAFVTGWLVERAWNRLNLILAVGACLVGGIGMVYLPGIPWLAFVGKVSLAKAAIGSAVFLPGDFLKALLAGMLAVAIRKAYPMIEK